MVVTIELTAGNSPALIFENLVKVLSGRDAGLRSPFNKKGANKMAKTATQQLRDVAAQSESINDALELADQGTAAAIAACSSFDPATTETNSRPTPRDDRWLSALGVQWRSLQTESLALRWHIGASCNNKLGGPTTSPMGGQMTPRDVASRIGCGLPDLHLMRWFARHVPDLNNFLDKHPGVNSWGKAKEVIAQLNSNRGTRKRSALGKLIGQIRRLASQHQQGKLAFAKEEVARLSSVLLRFSLALERTSRSTDASVEESK
jgi:hypothetical protein